MRLTLLTVCLCAVAATTAEDPAGRTYALVQDDRIDFIAGSPTQGGPFVTSCFCGPRIAKPYFHPLNAFGRDGAAIRLDRSFPMEGYVYGETNDHPHHRGLWFCHGDMIAEGRSPLVKIPGVEGADLWSEGVGRGSIVCTKIAGPRGVSADPWIETVNEWRGSDGAVLLRELRRLHSSGNLIAVDSTLTAAARAITFGDTKEGSFAVRVNDQFCEKRGGLIRNSVGKKSEKECWGQQADWCDCSGKVDGQPCGIAIFDHPDNQPRACWHVRAYGLMAANPFGRAKSGFPAMKGRMDLVKLKPGESLRLRYGVLLYAGEKKPEEIQKQYEAFAKLAK